MTTLPRYLGTERISSSSGVRIGNLQLNTTHGCKQPSIWLPGRVTTVDGHTR